MDWNEVTAIATAASSVIIIVSVVFLIIQIIELRRATQAQTFATALEKLQNEEIRAARRTVFQLKDKNCVNWSEDEIKEAEKVCHTYDSVAIMVRNKLLPITIIENWKYSLTHSWEILSPLITKYRNERPHPELWENFEWLATRLKGKSQDVHNPNTLTDVATGEPSLSEIMREIKKSNNDARMWTNYSLFIAVGVTVAFVGIGFLVQAIFHAQPLPLALYGGILILLGTLYMIFLPLAVKKKFRNK